VCGLIIDYESKIEIPIWAAKRVSWSHCLSMEPRRN